LAVALLLEACGASNSDVSPPKFVVTQTRWNVVACYEAIGVSTNPNDPTERADENRCPASALIKNIGGRDQGDLTNISLALLKLASNETPPTGLCTSDIPWIDPGQSMWVGCEVSDLTGHGPIPTQDGPPRATVI
jgi:hypothetical protein